MTSLPYIRPPSGRRTLTIWRDLGVAAVLFSSTNAFAAAATATGEQTEDDVVRMESFTVTGSNIVRADAEKVLPVSVISRDSIETRNALSPVDMLTSLPQVTNVPINESAQGGAGSRGDNAAINLRGIGVSNSLILLNGRRLASNPVSGATNYSVNVNQLPTQGISHIDVLRDGASSVYGSDAVAGVVNYVMDSGFRGTELKLRYGYPENGGGQSVEGTLTYGMDFADGRGRFLTTLNTMYRDAVYLTQRSFSANANHTAQAPAPFNALGGRFDGRSSVGFYPTYTVGTGTATNYFRPVGGALQFTTKAPSRTSDPDYFVNINDTSMGLPRLSRMNWYNGVEFDITDRLMAFADLSYYEAKSVNSRRGWGATQITAPGSDYPAPMSVDNPYNPYGSRFYSIDGSANADGTARIMGTPQSITLLSVLIDLPDGAGREKVTVSSDTARMVAGLKGQLSDTWKWETGVLLSEANVTDRSSPNVRESLFGNALMRTDATAYNPFGYTFKVQNGAVVPDKSYTNPSSVMSTYTDEWRRDGKSRIASWDISATGPILSIWSGDISLATGAEYRQEKFSDIREPYAGLNPPGSGLDLNNNDYLIVSPKVDSDGDRTVKSLFAELSIPLVAEKNNIPLVRLLELSASGRHERYSDFGNTTKPKFGLNWKPFSSVMLRASYNEGFTAPSLPVLYAPTQFSVDGAPGTVDPYRNVVTQEGPYLQKTYSTGNRALRPTSSRGKSAGIVFEVPSVKGLSFTADYWEISQRDVIGSLSTTQILASDAALLTSYVRSQIAAGVPVDSIDLGSGTAAYKGDPAVDRMAPRPGDVAAFASYNAANPGNPLAVVGQVISRSSPSLNLAEAFASGWDLNMNYRLPALPVGQISINSDWSYMIKSYTINQPPNAAALYVERLGVDGTTRWRGTTTLSWRKGNWSASFGGYYIGTYSDSAATTTAALYESLGKPSYIKKTFNSGVYVYRYVVRDSLTFNASVSYRFGQTDNAWLKNVSVRAGVTNLVDKHPPLASGAFGYTTSVYGNMLMGRTWTLDVTKRF
ncbi:TonB-dependent receptor [Opitutaceae bacterium]